MCACRVEEMKSVRRTSYDLEDFIFEMEANERHGSDPSEVNDVFGQLAQKEKDLILAAELGKALLDKNQELSQSHERMVEDFTQKLEQLEQEKHGLRRKLETVESEYESKIVELQSDISVLRKEFGQQQLSMGQTDRDRSLILNELTEQNQRLTVQLKQATHSEEQLSSQLKSVKEQFLLRKTNMHDHISQLEMLREEIDMITEKKADLERRIERMTQEREQMSQILEESTDRIILLEKQNKEQDFKLRNQTREMDELKHGNFQLQEKVDYLSRRSNSPTSLCHTSLFNEIEMSEDDMRSYNSSQCRSRNQSQLNTSGFHDMEDDEIECDDPDITDENEELMKLRNEIVDVYHQLELMCEQLRQQRGSCSSSSSEEISSAQIKVGMLTEVMKQMRGLIHDFMRKDSRKICLACGDGPTERENLEKEIAVTKDTVERMQRTLREKDDILKTKTEEIVDLSGKLTIKQAELSSVEEERDLLRCDLKDTHLSRDEIVTKAREARDEAVARKHTLEVELAKTRIEMMNTNSQLIEAIQQKLELSQQLEQWQVDMEALLEQQMKKKLQERAKPSEESDSSTNSASKNKFFALWR
uniref:Uncharacterized protein n=1 Tax=Strigamia maritima TaxID=126957 RepID=T1JL17_STRMM